MPTQDIHDTNLVAWYECQKLRVGIDLVQARLKLQPGGNEDHEILWRGLLHLENWSRVSFQRLYQGYPDQLEELKAYLIMLRLGGL